jgi:hypothetical protein
LDWFHLSMRIQHVAQAAKGWPDASAEDRKAGTRLSETIERIRWRLWHGQVRRGLDLIGETMATLEATTASSATSAALKVARLLSELETYVCGQADIIIDYATARRREEPISTAVTESTVQWLLHRRMNAQQPATDGKPVCPGCGCMVCYACPRPTGQQRWRCKACRSDFSITSGTLFAWHKLPLRTYLLAVAFFCNEINKKRYENLAATRAGTAQ